MIDSIAVERAKEAVVLAYERRRVSDRRWLRADLDSYDGFSNRITVLVLEGSPPKGIVICNFGLGVIQAFDCFGKSIRLKQTGG